MGGAVSTQLFLLTLKTPPMSSLRNGGSAVVPPRWLSRLHRGRFPARALARRAYLCCRWKPALLSPPPEEPPPEATVLGKAKAWRCEKSRISQSRASSCGLPPTFPVPKRLCKGRSQRFAEGLESKQTKINSSFPFPLLSPAA